MAVLIGGEARPIPGETVCGDLYGWWSADQRIVMALADGLGHGPGAAVAARAVFGCLEGHLKDSCEEMFAACEASLKSLRGAALAVAILDSVSNGIEIGIVGNVCGFIKRGGRIIRFTQSPGIVGGGYRNLIIERMVLAADDLLVMHSDGVDERISQFELHAAEVPLQSQVKALLERWARSGDDAAVLLYRHQS